MAKKALLDVLEQTIGKYVRNLDAESLNVAVWSGKIELNSLELDVGAVNGELDRQAALAPNLDLPFRVVSGRFGKFTVDVPWSRLMSQSVVLRASSLDVTLEPYDRTASDDFLSSVVESESFRKQQIIQQRIQSIEVSNEFRQRTNALSELAAQDLQSTSVESSSGSSSSSTTFTSRLVRRIIENMQIEINDVHLTVNSGESVAGVVLQSLQLATTDKNGVRTFVDRTVESNDTVENLLLYKHLSISGLGIYLDDIFDVTASNRRSKNVQLSALSAISEDGTNSEYQDCLDHSYILAPLSFEASLRQADSCICTEFPRYFLRSELTALSILFSRRQVELANAIAKQIRPCNTVARPLFPEYRPLERISSKNAKEWWKYATRCIGRLNGRRSWAEFFLAFQKRKQYVQLYKRHAHAASSSWMNPLKEYEVKELKNIEMDRTISVDGIMYWRNLADAQFKKEREKQEAKNSKNTTSVFYSLFGSSAVSKTATEEEPPITLSLEEMKELEHFEETSDFELTNDSKLYDVGFVLGSFRIHLTSFGARQLASLDMGTVSAEFKANADGSYDFDFGMASLSIHDKVTVNSHFPTILQNQQSGDPVDASRNDYKNYSLSKDASIRARDALRIKMDKTKEGHQKLQFKLSTFEAVASPLFLLELQKFTSFTTTAALSSDNAVLRRSLSGSVDIFYDAADGESLFFDDTKGTVGDWNGDGKLRVDNDAQGSKDDISYKLIDAWKTKTETRSTWTVNFDVQAPIVIIPESCVDPSADVLLFDLGHLRLNYGKMEGSGNVKKWFQNNPRGDDDSSEQILDNGQLQFTSLTFVVGKVSYWKHLARKREDTDVVLDEAVIEPVSLNLDFGIESSVQEAIPRVCMLGVLPSISFRLSDNQLSRIIAVSVAWKNHLNDLFPSKETESPVTDTHDNDETATQVSISSLGVTSKLIETASIFKDKSKHMQSRPFSKVYANMRLQRLSVKVLTESGGGMEAHLVSVLASTSILSDGSSVANLSMGWFWILDNIEYDFPRQQRLIVHSKLPVSVEEMMENSKQFIERLDEQEGSLQGLDMSTKLADISYKQRSAEQSFGAVDPFYVRQIEGDKFDVDSIVDAAFSSLFVNWNPRAVKRIQALLGDFSESLTSQNEHVGEVLVPEALLAPTKRRFSISSSTVGDKPMNDNTGVMLLRAKMDGLHLSLNSAVDDLPLFTLSMASVSISMISSKGQDQSMSLLLGDLKVVSADMGRTDPLYRNVLGLSTNTTDSLLSVRYYSGAKAIASVAKDGTRLTDCDTYAEVELSPMRMVYIHSQVLALVEYSTEGILGAIATQAASSAAQAAADLVAPAASKKIFHVKASKMELLLPIAAYKREFFSVNLGSLCVEYTATLASGGHAKISLLDVMIQGAQEAALLELPVRMDVTVSLPPDGIGTNDDQAYRVRLQISNAPFTISKAQYAQIFTTLEENVGEIDLCLRDRGSLMENAMDVSKAEKSTLSDPNHISHAGVEIIDNPRWIYLYVDMNALSLRLCGEDENDPIIQISAVNASVELNMFPDQQKKKTQVTLRDLFCNDERLKTLGRQHRSLVYQSRERRKAEKHGQDAFVISYCTDEIEKQCSFDVKIGSPMFVLIPDAISDVLAFLGQSTPNNVAEKIPNSVVEDYRETVEVDAVDEGSAIEAVFVEKIEEQVSSMSFSLQTSSCCLIFVDLGTALPAASVWQTKSSVGSVAETLVLGGIFQAKALMVSRGSDGTVTSLEADLHGEDIEAYTAFGQDLRSAVQILDPAHFTLLYDTKVTSALTRKIDIRCAALTPVELTISMRNIALVNAITASLSDCFEDECIHHDTNGSKILSSNEAERIEHLAAALENDSLDISQHSFEVTQQGVVEVARETPKSVSSLSTTQTSLKLTTSDVQVTLVNDLQGLDEALLRVKTRNLVANGKIMEGARISPTLPSFTAFDFTFHTSVLADYFDVSSNTWKALLQKPWEISSKGYRGRSRQTASSRPSTALDIESLSCHISFSEQFLMSLASANRMWTVYSAASSSVIESLDPSLKLSRGIQRSMAASAARTFVASLPYAVANHAGFDLEILINSAREERVICKNGAVEYFRFEPPAGKGSGGRRLYGQDVNFEKSATLFIFGRRITLPHLDSLLGMAKRSHNLHNGVVVMTDVVKEGKTVTLHVSSGIEFHNRTSLPFFISMVQDGKVNEVGQCHAHYSRSKASLSNPSFNVKDGNVARTSRRKGVPVELAEVFRREWDQKGDSKLSFLFKPKVVSVLDDWELCGESMLRVNKGSFSGLPGKQIKCRFNVTCRPLQRQGQSGSSPPRTLDSFVFQVSVSMALVDGLFPSIDIFLEPRAVIKNEIPIGVQVRSPMPHIYGHILQSSQQCGNGEHCLAPDSFLEIFTPGPSIAVMVKCNDLPIGGTSTDWMEGGWVDLPLLSEHGPKEPIRCMFPFEKKSSDPLALSCAQGSEFFIVEGNRGHADLAARSLQSTTADLESSVVEPSASTEIKETQLTFYITLCNYAVDHTGHVLFEQMENSAIFRRSSLSGPHLHSGRRKSSSSGQIPRPFGAYVSARHSGRITMLPGLNVPIRLLHLTMEGDDGVRRSSPFNIEDISICDGGVDATPLTWEDRKSSGFFAYRKLVSSYQSEIHIVPEYIVYNGSQHHRVRVKQPTGGEVTIAPGKFSAIRKDQNDAAVISVEYPELCARTPFARVDSLGLRVFVVKLENTTPIGSVAIQTVMGARDSRLVVKLGDIQHALLLRNSEDMHQYGMIQNDFFRFRIRWTELQLTLNEAGPSGGSQKAGNESVFDRFSKAISPTNNKRDLGSKPITPSAIESNPVCTILFHRFTVDWQRVFKEDVNVSQMKLAQALQSPERSQLSVVIHHVQIRDNTPNSLFPIVFNSVSEISFFDLCIRTRGSTNADIVQVDLIDLNLAHRDGVSEKIYISTSEDFVWKVVDVADRIIKAAAEFAGIDLQLTWDDEQECFLVSIREQHFIENETKYTPPESNRLYDIKKTRVSPFTTVVSFTRNPQATRYTLAHDVSGAPIINYFTKQLKFKIEKAELTFARYEANHVKGPPDRVLELLLTVYMSRIKTKLVSIMTAASFQDWKYLASREEGDDEFMDGDVLRVTGNLAGKTAGYLLKQTGKGISGGISNATSTIGGAVEKASVKIGAGKLGAGVNSVVSGVGEGFGDTVSGVGTGAGLVLQGAGQGIGHVFGGITGGAMMMGKGIGKGIVTGDARVATSGIVQGATTLGTGVGQGVESVVTGAAGGVLSVGQGLFSGVKTVGKGIGGAFTGKKPMQRKHSGSGPKS